MVFDPKEYRAQKAKEYAAEQERFSQLVAQECGLPPPVDEQYHYVYYPSFNLVLLLAIISLVGIFLWRKKGTLHFVRQAAYRHWMPLTLGALTVVLVLSLFVSAYLRQTNGLMRHMDKSFRVKKISKETNVYENYRACELRVRQNSQ